ncbi:MAG: MMPL family transporter [Chloroflexota bacterium]|nr:MMPL family transporter [Chloroflexota bacterium]
MPRLLSTAGLARISARKPWLVVGLWVVLLVLAGIAQSGLKDVVTTEQTFTNNPEAVRATELLEERLRGPKPVSETVIVRSETTTVDDPAFQAVVDETVAALRGMNDVVASAASYYEAQAAGSPAAPGMVSADRHATVIPVTLVGEFDAVAEQAPAYLDLVAAQNRDGFEVLTVGDASAAEEWGKIAQEDLAKGEGIGIGVALVVLVAVFAALVAAGVPIVLALVSIVVALGLTAVVGRVYELSNMVENIITMIGLAVGIDYALFIVERYREERRRGVAKREAIELAGSTASKAVLFSGFTVIIALMGMFFIPTNVFRSIGLGAILVVFAAILASLTLIPAMLSLLGDKVDWPRRRKYDEIAAQQPVHDSETIHAGFWGRITRVVMARPAISAVLAIALLVVATLPLIGIRTGQAGVETFPDGEVKRAFTILERDFYAGMVAPVEIVVDGSASDPAVKAGIEGLVATLGGNNLYGPASVTTNPAGDLTLVSVPMAVDPNERAAQQAITDLRDDVIPAAFQGTDAEVLVGGGAAFAADFNALVADYTPIVFAFVLGLSFLLLLVVFRSIVVPLKAILMNLLSVGAAYGLTVLVFQHGVGAELFGFQQTPTIEAWLPIFLFSILFGLSMDYHVFLLSRVKEHYDRTGNNGESVAVGLQATAKIITGAALIMVAVFGGFASGRLVALQQMGFGLAVAVFLDATIVRSVLVPAGMAMLGDRNWYLPSWLSWLPNLNVEGAPAPAPAAAPEPVAVPAPAPVRWPVTVLEGLGGDD